MPVNLDPNWVNVNVRNNLVFTNGVNSIFNRLGFLNNNPLIAPAAGNFNFNINVGINHSDNIKKIIRSYLLKLLIGLKSI
jgi:hypothetical protein